jgi:hypothetical protein
MSRILDRIDSMSAGELLVLVLVCAALACFIPPRPKNHQKPTK